MFVPGSEHCYSKIAAVLHSDQVIQFSFAVFASLKLIFFEIKFYETAVRFLWRCANCAIRHCCGKLGYTNFDCNLMGIHNFSQFTILGFQRDISHFIYTFWGLNHLAQRKNLQVCWFRVESLSCIKFQGGIILSPHPDIYSFICSFLARSS